jgi:hypothetical protein
VFYGMSLNSCRSSGGESLTITAVDNKGNICNEISHVNTSDGRTITTQTSFLNGQVTAQNVTVRDSQGRVETTHFLGGKIQP